MGNRKRLKRADRTYKDLKQKQKAKIADCMFEKTCDYYREHDKLPEGEDSEKIAGQIYQRVKGIAEKASFDEVYRLYLYRLPRYEARIAEIFPYFPPFQSENHIPGTLKISDVFFPAYSAFTVLQPDKLLFHLPSAVRAYFFAHALFLGFRLVCIFFLFQQRFVAALFVFIKLLDFFPEVNKLNV